MARSRLVGKGGSVRKIIDTGGSQKRMDPDVLGEALRAEAVTSATRKGSPISLVAVGQEVARRLRSSGGRPALEGATRRQKIPVSQSEWEKLVALAESLSRAGISISPGQLASVLLHLALEEVDERDLVEAITAGGKP